ETYSTRVRRFGSSGGGDAASLSIAHRNAASVLPDPVGATTSVSSPRPMARQAPAWACDGSANAPSNQARGAREHPSSPSPGMLGGESSGMLPYCPDPLTFSAAVRIRQRPRLSLFPNGPCLELTITPERGPGPAEGGLRRGRGARGGHVSGPVCHPGLV